MYGHGCAYPFVHSHNCFMFVHAPLYNPFCTFAKLHLWGEHCTLPFVHSHNWPAKMAAPKWQVCQNGRHGTKRPAMSHYVPRCIILLRAGKKCPSTGHNDPSCQNGRCQNGRLPKRQVPKWQSCQNGRCLPKWQVCQNGSPRVRVARDVARAGKLPGNWPKKGPRKRAVKGSSAKNVTLVTLCGTVG